MQLMMVATSSPCEVIKTVWSRIEEFSDLPATIAVAQTCQELHRVIVDGETRRVKVSQFVVVEWESSPPHKTIPHYVPTALNSIHMQSVRKIHLDFPKIKRFEEEVLEDEESEYIKEDIDIIAACFPVFATQLAYATNLQSLQLDLTKILSHNLEQYILPVMNIFRTNLVKCKQLKEIDIHGYHHNYDPELVKTLMRAIVPTIKRQRYVLKQIAMKFSLGDPHETIGEPNFALKAVATDFYENALRCSRLQHLDLITRNSDLSEAFLDAASRNAKKTSSQKKQKTLADNTGLYHLRLKVCGLSVREDRRNGTSNRSELTGEQIQHDSDRTKLLLERFSHCPELEQVTLDLASHVWGSLLNSVGKVLRGCPKLTYIELSFGGYKDKDDQVLDTIYKILLDKDNKFKCKIKMHIYNLHDFDGKNLFKLILYKRENERSAYSPEGSFYVPPNNRDGDADEEEQNRPRTDLRDVKSEKEMPTRVNVVNMYL